MKRYLNLAAAAGVIALLAYTYCSGRNAGRDEDRIKNIQATAEMHKKAAELYKSEAAREKKRGDSLERKVNYADSVVQDKNASLVKASLSYKHLRDSVLKAHGETPISVISVITAADSALAASSAVIRAHEAKDSLQDSVIASQKRRIGFLEIALSEKDEQIDALNRGMATRVRQVKSARHKGWIEGASVTAFAGFLLQASK
jgi:hypothetical protein